MERLAFMSSKGRVSYLFRPGKIPFIFLHGLGGTGNTWLKLTSLLDDRFALYFLDLLCQGRSDIMDDGCTIADQCYMLNEFVMSLGAQKFGLVGNSYGGWISLRYALHYDPKPEYLVLIDSAGLNPSVGESDADLSAAFLDRVMMMSRYNRRDVIKKMLEYNSRPDERISISDLKRIRSRTLIIWGELDSMIPLSYGRTMHENIIGSAFHIIKEAAHVPQTEHYREVATQIVSFAPD
jgi:pimeloyl-ACP methyl ester carboxylesterase